MSPNVALAQFAERHRKLSDAIRKGTVRDVSKVVAHYAGVLKDTSGVPTSLALSNPDSALVSQIDDKAKAVPFIVTVLQEDRDGDVVIPRGIETKNYYRNPVVFFGHQEWVVPIGKAKSNGRLAWDVTDKDARSVCYFDAPDPDSMFIYGKVQRGFLSATSIAFVPVEAYKRDEYDKAYRGEKDSMMPVGWLFKRVDLTEWSIVGVPSNAGAIRDALDSEKSFISPRLQKALVPYAAQPRGRCFSGWCPVPAKAIARTPIQKGATSVTTKGPYEDASRRNGIRAGNEFKQGGIAQQIIAGGDSNKIRQAAESRCPPILGPSKDAWIEGFIEAAMKGYTGRKSLTVTKELCPNNGRMTLSDDYGCPAAFDSSRKGKVACEGCGKSLDMVPFRLKGKTKSILSSTSISKSFARRKASGNVQWTGEINGSPAGIVAIGNDLRAWIGPNKFQGNILWDQLRVEWKYPLPDHGDRQYLEALLFTNAKAKEKIVAATVAKGKLTPKYRAGDIVQATWAGSGIPTYTDAKIIQVSPGESKRGRGDGFGGRAQVETATRYQIEIGGKQYWADEDILEKGYKSKSTPCSCSGSCGGKGSCGTTRKKSAPAGTRVVLQRFTDMGEEWRIYPASSANSSKVTAPMDMMDFHSEAEARQYAEGKGWQIVSVSKAARRVTKGDKVVTETIQGKPAQITISGNMALVGYDGMTYVGNLNNGKVVWRGEVPPSSLSYVLSAVVAGHAKSLNSTSGTSGGYLVPDQFEDEDMKTKTKKPATKTAGRVVKKGEGSTAYNIGWNDRVKGARRNDNPFSMDRAEEFRDWAQGWIAADKADQRGEKITQKSIARIRRKDNAEETAQEEATEHGADMDVVETAMEDSPEAFAGEETPEEEAGEEAAIEAVKAPHSAHALAQSHQHLKALKDFIAAEDEVFEPDSGVRKYLKDKLEPDLDHHMEKMAEMFGSRYPNHDMEKLCGGSSKATDEIDEEDVVTKGRRRKSAVRQKRNIYSVVMEVTGDGAKYSSYPIGKWEVDHFDDESRARQTAESYNQHISPQMPRGALRYFVETVGEESPSRKPPMRKSVRKETQMEYRTPFGTFATWEEAARRVEQADMDPTTTIEIVRKSVQKAKFNVGDSVRLASGSSISDRQFSDGKVVEVNEGLFAPYRVEWSGGHVGQYVADKLRKKSAVRRKGAFDQFMNVKEEGDEFMEEKDELDAMSGSVEMDEDEDVEKLLPVDQVAEYTHEKLLPVDEVADYTHEKDEAEGDIVLEGDVNGTDDPETMTEEDADEIVSEATEEILERYQAQGKGRKKMAVRKGFKVGDKVAWTMQDGNVMAGDVTFLGHDNLTVRRVDGGVVTVPTNKVRPASSSDISAGISFYQNIGKSKRRLTLKNLSGRWFVKSVTKDGEELTGPFDTMDEATEVKAEMETEEKGFDNPWWDSLDVQERMKVTDELGIQRSYAGKPWIQLPHEVREKLQNYQQTNAKSLSRRRKGIAAARKKGVRKYAETIYVPSAMAQDYKQRIEGKGGKVTQAGTGGNNTVKLNIEGSDSQIGWAIHHDRGANGDREVRMDAGAEVIEEKNEAQVDETLLEDGITKEDPYVEEMDMDEDNVVEMSEDEDVEKGFDEEETETLDELEPVKSNRRTKSVGASFDDWMARMEAAAFRATGVKLN